MLRAGRIVRGVMSAGALTVGAVLWSTPVGAVTFPNLCARLAAAIDALQALAAQFPNGPVIAALLARALHAYGSFCS